MDNTVNQSPAASTSVTHPEICIFFDKLDLVSSEASSGQEISDPSDQGQTQRPIKLRIRLGKPKKQENVEIHPGIHLIKFTGTSWTVSSSQERELEDPEAGRIRLVKTEPGQPTIGIAEGRICIQIAEHFPDQSSHGESEIIQTVPEIKTEPEEPPQGLSLEETGAIDDYETKPSPQLIDVLTARNTHENVAVGDDSYNKETGNYWINTDVTSFTTSTKTESQVVSDKSHKYPELRIRHDPFTIEYDPFTSEHDPFTIEHDPSTFEHDPFTFEHDPFTIEHP
ncbi:hypothetical protein RF11_08303 [Thelohanellus kitauei]|uniref:Uncharacterized protein n=1 Tax=Thelohanellus kitauei TaxID=669202 RepID=A0A0C2NEV6_THEKT|nr:hypothetical protein RF11_08303 [Thelohanellus kitauei]